VHVGAIITIPASDTPVGELDQKSNVASAGFNRDFGTIDILGETLLDRLRTKLLADGVNEISVVKELASSSFETSIAHNSFWIQWDGIVSRYLSLQARTILLIRLGAHVEIDFADLIRAHRETTSPMTQVFDRHGALDLVAIDGNELSSAPGTYRARLRSLLFRQHRYVAPGYCNRLRTFQDLRALVVDGLSGIAALRPVGREISPNVWAADGAMIHESAEIEGPAFIGANTRVNADCSISGLSSIERNCRLDCGTNVHQSSILADTQLGVGLNVRNSVVAGNSLHHLGRNLMLRVDDARILSQHAARKSFVEVARNFARRTNLIREESCQPSSSDLHL
jgi:carbonic anhydrase/acetyltransferase-like protein (isoleucine patch superfamily)